MSFSFNYNNNISDPIQQIPAVLSYEAPSGGLSHGFGTCPSGTMTTTYNNGFIELYYDIPSAVQRSYHPHPGLIHSNVHRVAYISSSGEGQDLLVRYQYAFLFGHSFSVGRSMTTGLDNEVTWSQYVPHKTSTRSGPPFGLPDPNYVSIANQAMDHLGIPRDIHTCRRWILQRIQQQRQQQGVNNLMSSPDQFVVRQETIHYTAPAQWNANDQFSKFLESVPMPQQQQQHQSSLERAAVAASVTASAPSGDLFGGNGSFSSTNPHANNQDWISSLASSMPTARHGNPSNLFSSFNNQQLHPASIVAAQDLNNQTGPKEDDECPICLDVLFDVQNVQLFLSQSPPVVSLKSCKHLFHRQCILDSLMQHHDKCPSCRTPIGVEPNGKGPSGTMTVTLDTGRRCPGFSDSDGIITINYNLPSRMQTSYMENPGQIYSGTARIAYLPHNTEGRQLLARIRYAFQHGLCFRVGTSLTTGRPNQITW
jgi:deltex-like protein